MAYAGSARWAGALALLFIAGFASVADAYTAAGDRTFPATILIPQIAPTDEFYLTTSATHPAPGRDLTNFTSVYNKTITERLSFGIKDGYNWLDRPGVATLSGFQNLETTARYLAVLDPESEFLASLGVDRAWGGTGQAALGASASPKGATTPQFTFGKGMLDIGADYLRPVGLAGIAGYQISDGKPRPDLWQLGFALDYSIPYLEAKVQSVDLPDFVRALTPLVEVLFGVPSGSSFGARTTITVAPGVNYAGGGWEFGLEALLPATRATGSGVGVAAQLHFSLDYLFAGGFLGRPIFSSD